MIIESGEYNYDVKSNKSNDKVTLNRSLNDLWTNPGERVAKLKEDDNGIKIDHQDLGRIKMDYSQAMEIYYLLNEYVCSSNGPNGGEFKIFKG